MFVCECGEILRHQPNLSRHKKKCQARVIILEQKAEIQELKAEIEKLKENQGNTIINNYYYNKIDNNKCIHGKYKSSCRICLGPEKYNEYLLKQRERYYQKRGIKPGDIHIKKFEKEMIDYLQNKYPESELILGGSIGNECTENKTHRYPDVQLWKTSFLIVFECDENAHRANSYNCDFKRMNEIAISVGVPVWFIRWNPHGDEPIDNIGQICDDILEMNLDDIVWEHLHQFNVTYIGYNKKDKKRNEERITNANAIDKKE
jgi:hypothetical protein